MTSKLAPYLSQIPIGKTSDGKDVLSSPDFVRWLNEALIPRIGGTVAQTNLELAKAVQSLAASEMVIQPATADRILPDVFQPATGEQLFPDVMQSIDAVGLDEITFQH